jgi:RimJ/RimL family protein N-acetyltransferase
VHASVSLTDNITSVRISEKMGFVKTGEQYYEEFRNQPYKEEMGAIMIVI